MNVISLPPTWHSARKAPLPEVPESNTDANALYESIQAITQFKQHRTIRKKPSAPPLHSIFLGYHFQHLVEFAVIDSKHS